MAAGVPDSKIPTFLPDIVNSWIDARIQGAPSSVGGSVNYGNPYTSDSRNRPWVEALNGPRYGVGQSIHYHGTVPDKTAVPDTTVTGDLSGPSASMTTGTGSLLSSALAPWLQSSPDFPWGNGTDNTMPGADLSTLSALSALMPPIPARGSTPVPPLPLSAEVTPADHANLPALRAGYQASMPPLPIPRPNLPAPPALTDPYAGLTPVGDLEAVTRRNTIGQQLGDAASQRGQIVRGPDGQTYQSVQMGGTVGNPTSWGWEAVSTSPPSVAPWISQGRVPSTSAAPTSLPEWIAQALSGNAPQAGSSQETVANPLRNDAWANIVATPSAKPYTGNEPNYIGLEVSLPETSNVAGNIAMPRDVRPSSISYPNVAPWLASSPAQARQAMSSASLGAPPIISPPPIAALPPSVPKTITKTIQVPNPNYMPLGATGGAPDLASITPYLDASGNVVDPLAPKPVAAPQPTTIPKTVTVPNPAYTATPSVPVPRIEQTAGYDWVQTADGRWVDIGRTAANLPANQQNLVTDIMGGVGKQLGQQFGADLSIKPLNGDDMADLIRRGVVPVPTAPSRIYNPDLNRWMPAVPAPAAPTVPKSATGGLLSLMPGGNAGGGLLGMLLSSFQQGQAGKAGTSMIPGVGGLASLLSPTALSPAAAANHAANGTFADSNPANNAANFNRNAGTYNPDVVKQTGGNFSSFSPEWGYS